MCICITFTRTRKLFNTTLTGPVTFGGRELCVLVLYVVGSDSYLCLLVLHSARQDSCLGLLCWPRDIWKTGVMCTCIIFCWIRQLLNTNLTGPVAFGGRELCVPLKAGALLFTFTAISVFLVALIYNSTEEQIKHNEAQLLIQRLGELVKIMITTFCKINF